MHSQHTIAPGEAALQLDIPLLLPGVEDAGDGCVERLQERLRAQRGIARAHIEMRGATPVLCLHYDPNLVPLEKLQRLTRDEGAQLVQRFHHETWRLRGLDCASCAASIEHVVKRVPGVLQAGVNYSTSKLKIEYDATQTDRAKISKAVARLGYRVDENAAREYSPPRNGASCDGEHRHSHDSHGAHSQASGIRANHDGAHDSHSHSHSHDHAHGFAANARHQSGTHSHETGASTGGGWLHRHRELALSLACGTLLAVAFFGEAYFALPRQFALLFYAAAYFAGGYELARHVVPALLHGRFGVDFLMLAGATGAAFLGDFAEGAFLLFLFSLGHSLEHLAMERARDAISALGKLAPKTALIRRDETETTIPVEDIRLHDIAIVRPGDRVPVDGIIVQGQSSLDQSAITGESVPVEKESGDAVFAGSINGDGALEVRVTKLSRDTTMARVLALVEEAQAQKSASQNFAEKFERIVVPLILGVVVFAAIVPPLLGWLSWKVAFLRAVSAMVAASPCALALATPAAVLAAIGQAARGGVLIKGGVHLENLGGLRAIALDKTGTLTRGKPEVCEIAVANGAGENEILRLAATIETRSSHPLAQAVLRRAALLDDASNNRASTREFRTVSLAPSQHDEAARVDERANANGNPGVATREVHNLAGRGVVGEVGGETVRLGNAKMFEEAGIALPPELAKQLGEWSESGKPSMLVARGETILGALAFSDAMREEAPRALKKLRELGVSHLIMLTGDNARVAQSVAREVGVTDFRADLLPENKVRALRELMKKHGAVAMVGDGVNDAPALATSTVGIAMGAGGADVALETADVALMGDDLSKLPFAVALSRAARAVIRQNLFIALGVIALLVPLTLFGVARLGVAVLFHEGSTLIVCANALRLLRFKLRD